MHHIVYHRSSEFALHAAIAVAAALGGTVACTPAAAPPRAAPTARTSRPEPTAHAARAARVTTPEAKLNATVKTHLFSEPAARTRPGARPRPIRPVLAKLPTLRVLPRQCIALRAAVNCWAARLGPHAKPALGALYQRKDGAVCGRYFAAIAHTLRDTPAARCFGGAPTALLRAPKRPLILLAKHHTKGYKNVLACPHGTKQRRHAHGFHCVVRRNNRWVRHGPDLTQHNAVSQTLTMWAYGRAYRGEEERGCRARGADLRAPSTDLIFHHTYYAPPTLRARLQYRPGAPKAHDATW